MSYKTEYYFLTAIFSGLSLWIGLMSYVLFTGAIQRTYCVRRDYVSSKKCDLIKAMLFKSFFVGCELGETTTELECIEWKTVDDP